MQQYKMVVQNDLKEVTISDIPNHVVRNFAHATIVAVEKYFTDPEVAKKYKAWKKEYSKKKALLNQ